MSDTRDAAPKTPKGDVPRDNSKPKGEVVKDKDPVPRKADPELTTMARLSRELDKINDPETRARVVRWLVDRYVTRTTVRGDGFHLTGSD